MEVDANVLVRALVFPLRCERREGLRERIVSEIRSCVSDCSVSVLNECVNWLWSNYNFMGLNELAAALDGLEDLTVPIFKVRMASYQAARRGVLRDLVKREVQLI